MSPPLIREATVDDLDVIVDFNARLAQETEGKSLPLATLARGVTLALQDRDRLSYWVAEVDDGGSLSVVGQAAITREWSDWRAGWIWWFQSVYVHPDHRKKAVFRTLYAQIRDLAKATDDVIGLRLYVEESNERAQQVYRSLGMTPGGYEVYEELWLPA